MDSGLILAFWLEMIGWGFAAGMITHLILRRIAPLTVLASAAVPPILYLVLLTLKRGLATWTDPELVVAAMYMLITGAIAALPTAWIGAWLGQRLRQAFHR
jgi:hypothetical protein